MFQQAGDRFSDYYLAQPLGSGGFSEVWLGKNATNQREVAVKILNIQLPIQEEQDEFLKEARHLARLVHPHIIRLLDCGIQKDKPYLILEYASNGTLRQHHPKGSKLSLYVVLQYVKQIAEGLQFAHDNRIIHRDIKPENLLLDSYDTVLLSDFGIALPGQTLPHPKTQNVMGTTGYMAPEQLDGHPALASDQYSLAIVVYEWLCGSLPFKGNLIDIAKQQQSSPPSLIGKAPGITPAVEQVIFKALTRDVTGRYRRVQDFADALEQAINSPYTPLNINIPNNQPVQKSPLNNPPAPITPFPVNNNVPAGSSLTSNSTLLSPVNVVGNVPLNPPAPASGGNNAPAGNNLVAGGGNAPAGNNPFSPANSAHSPLVGNPFSPAGSGVNVGLSNNPVPPASGGNNPPAGNNLAPPVSGGGNAAANNNPVSSAGGGINTPVGNTPATPATPAGGVANNPFLSPGVTPASNAGSGAANAPQATPGSNAGPGSANAPQGPLVLPGTVSQPTNANQSPFAPIPPKNTQGTSLHNQHTQAARPQTGGSPFGATGTPAPKTTTAKSRLGDKWFDRNFIRNNRNFIYTGGIIDFILAAALGIWLNGKDLSWDLWFVSLVCALTVRGICAAIKKQYSTIAYITVALLTFYWFVGSWALGTILHNATPLEPVPSHIIALVFTVLGIVWHIRFVQRRKR